VAQQFSLTDKQRRAFEIISTTLIKREILKLDDWVNADLLVMFLTDPGGTGKSHVVRAVHEVMKFFGKEHCICFVAHTGTAANLINGTTIHSGLGI
ncbi:hypothetical protein BT96DRAFT_750336, partial [Gymnopus androsaceus JB14]